MQKTFEDTWVEIYKRARREHCNSKKRRAERELVKLGIVDDTIAWEASVEGQSNVQNYEI